MPFLKTQECVGAFAALEAGSGCPAGAGCLGMPGCWTDAETGDADACPAWIIGYELKEGFSTFHQQRNGFNPVIKAHLFYTQIRKTSTFGGSGKF
jgi:hypothetical protein